MAGHVHATGGSCTAAMTMCAVFCVTLLLVSQCASSGSGKALTPNGGNRSSALVRAGIAALDVGKVSESSSSGQPNAAQIVISSPRNEGSRRDREAVSSGNLQPHTAAGLRLLSPKAKTPRSGRQVPSDTANPNGIFGSGIMSTDTMFTRTLSDSCIGASDSVMSFEDRRKAFQLRSTGSYENLRHASISLYGSQQNLVEDLVRLGLVPPQESSPMERQDPIQVAQMFSSITEGDTESYVRVFGAGQTEPHVLARNINGLLFHIVSTGSLPTRPVHLGQLTRSQTWKVSSGTMFATTPSERFGSPLSMASLFVPDRIPEDAEVVRQSSLSWNVIEEDLGHRPIAFAREAFLYAVRDLLFDCRVPRIDPHWRIDAMLLARVVYLGRVLDARLQVECDADAQLRDLLAGVLGLINGSETVDTLSSLFGVKLSCPGVQAMRELLSRHAGIIENTKRSTSDQSV